MCSNTDQFVCKINGCGKVFATRQGLGGHVSKSHPGQSITYREKVVRRDQRKNDRLILSIAKQLMTDIELDNLEGLSASIFKRQRKQKKNCKQSNYLASVVSRMKFD